MFFIPDLEVRKPGGNCARECPGCIHTINNSKNDESFDMTTEQKQFFDKIMKIFEVNYLPTGKDINGITVSIPFVLTKLNDENFKKTIDMLKLDNCAAFSFMTSKTIEEFVENYNEIERKTNIIFEENIKKTGFQKNTTINLASSKGGIKKLSEDLLNGSDKIKKYIENIDKYVDNISTIQVGRIVVPEEDFEKNCIAGKTLIKSLIKKLDYNNIRLLCSESDTYSEYEVEIKTQSGKLFYIHLGIVSDNSVEESVEGYVENLRSIQNEFLLSFLDNEIQVNHSLGRVNDVLNRISYEELTKILEDLEDLKTRFEKINTLKIGNSLNNLLKFISLNELIYKAKIAGLIDTKNKVLNDNEKAILYNTYDLLKKDNRLERVLTKGTFSSAFYGLYLRQEVIKIIQNKKEQT